MGDPPAYPPDSGSGSSGTLPRPYKSQIHTPWNTDRLKQEAGRTDPDGGNKDSPHE